MIGKSSPFFLAQRVGSWQWPMLLVSFLAAFLATIAIAGVVYGVAFGAQELLDADWAREFVTSYSSEDSDIVLTSPGAILFELCVIGLVFWGAAIVGRSVHQRNPMSLVTPLRAFRWPVAGKVLALEILLRFILTGVDLLASDKVLFSGFGLRHLIWTVPLMAATLFQTTGEDVFFKGYLLQQLGAITKVGWLAPILVTTVFVLAHIGNPDIQNDILFIIILFVSSELLIIYFLMRTGGMEIPFVLHWTNNISIFLFVAEADTQANDLTLWVTSAPTEEVTPVLTNIVSTMVYFGYLGALALGLLWSRSPFYVGAQPVLSVPGNVDGYGQPTFSTPTDLP